MPNHVHLILTPTRSDGLGLAVGEAHRRYTNFINARARWTGHLFQSRFSSVAMDEDHLMAAARYVSLNPVRARLVARARDWPWSSVRAHLSGADDELVEVRPILDREPRFAAVLEEGGDEGFAALRRSEGSGRPVGTPEFVAGLERVLGRPIARRAPGRRPAGAVQGSWTWGFRYRVDVFSRRILLFSVFSVEAVAPEAVVRPAKGSSEIYGLKEASLVPILVEAIKAQQAEIKQLQADV